MGPNVGISILADFRLMGISFHAAVVFGLGKDFLFKSALGHCYFKEKIILKKTLLTTFFFLPKPTLSSTFPLMSKSTANENELKFCCQLKRPKGPKFKQINFSNEALLQMAQWTLR